MSVSNDSPLKVSSDAKDLIRYAAAVFACTQGEFVEKAVAEYLKAHDAEVKQRARELSARVEKLAQ
jgi:uncharacterized protein (DUF1778 family)